MLSLPPRYTPEDLSTLGEQLTELIQKFGQWNIRAADSGRLRQAAHVLLAAGAGGVIPANTAEARLRFANAISDAFDFSDIAKALGEEQIRSLARDIERAMKGSLGRSGFENRGYAFQSQFWVGALLALAGFNPVPIKARSTPTPDFEFVVTSLPYGAEVKRLAAGSSVRAHLAKANEQLAAVGYFGVAFIDFSAQLDDMNGEVVRVEDMPEARREYYNRFRYLAGEMEDSLLSKNSAHSPARCDRILFAAAFTRNWFWYDVQNPHPCMHVVLAGTGRPMRNTVYGLQRRQIIDGILTAFEKVGFHYASRTDWPDLPMRSA